MLAVMRNRVTWVVCALVALATASPISAQIEVAEATITELQEAMTSGRATSVQITEAYLARIHAYDQAGPRLNAMIRLNPSALTDAEALDRANRDSIPGRAGSSTRRSASNTSRSIRSGCRSTTRKPA